MPSIVVAAATEDHARIAKWLSGIDAYSPPVSVVIVSPEDATRADWYVVTRRLADLDPPLLRRIIDGWRRVARAHLLLIDSVALSPEELASPRTVSAHTEDLLLQRFYEVSIRAPLQAVVQDPEETLFGRSTESDLLVDYIQDLKRRVVTVEGIGGQGKTTLTRHVMSSLLPDVPWIDVSDSPSLPALVLRFQRALGLPMDGESQSLLGARDVADRLVVVENLESIMLEGQLIGPYLRLLTLLVSGTHVRLLLTTRVAPQALSDESAASSPVITLRGLGATPAQELLASFCDFDIPLESAEAISVWCDGNPLAMKLLAGTITSERQLRPGAIRATLAAAVYDISALVDSHLEHLSTAELNAVQVLAWEGGHLNLEKFGSLLGDRLGIHRLVGGLRRRNLVEIDAGGNIASLHSMVREAVQVATRDRLVKEIGADVIGTDVLTTLLLVNPHSSPLTQSDQYALTRSAVDALLDLGLRGETRWRMKLDQMLAVGRTVGLRPVRLCANVVTLARLSETPLSGMDLSDLLFQDCDFRGLDLAKCDFSGSQFKGCEFSDDFGPITSVAILDDEQQDRWVAGTFEGHLRVWNQDGSLRSTIAVDNSWISSIVGDDLSDLIVATVSGGVFHVNAITGEVVKVAATDSQIRGMVGDPRGAVYLVCSSGALFVLDCATGDLRELWRADYRLKFVCQRLSDGLLALGGDSPTIVLLSPTTMQVATSQSGSRVDWNRCGLFRPDGALVVGSDSGEIAVWAESAGSWTVGHAVEHGSRVWSLATDAASNVLLTGGNDGAIRVWDPQTLEARGVLVGHSSWVRSIAVRPDGRTAFSGGEDQRSIVWDLDTQAPIFSKIGYSRRAFSVDFLDGDPDGVVCSTGDHRLVRMSTEGVRPPESWRGHTDQVFVCRASRGLVASASDDGEVRIWSEDGRDLVALAGTHNGWIGALAFRRDGALLASGGDDRRIVLTDTVIGTSVGSRVVHAGRISGLAFADEALLASCSEDGSVRLSRIPSLEPIDIRDPVDGPLYSLAVGTTEIFAAGASGRVWKLEPAAVHSEILDIGMPIWSLALSPDGLLLALGADDGRVLVHDLQNGSLAEVTRHNGQAWCVTWSADGTRIASAGQDATVHIVREASPTRILTVPALYDEMVLRKATGFSSAEKGMLTRLGAIWSG